MIDTKGQHRPAVLDLRVAGIPQELRDARRWILWRYDFVGGVWRKVPYQTNGNKASSTDKNTWDTFERAHLTFMLNDYSGLGFVLGDGWFGIDLDDSLMGGVFTPLADRILHEVEGYAEVSPSGTGVKLITRGDVRSKVNHGKGLEMYGAGRYFAITGHRLNGHATIPAQLQNAALEQIIARELGDVRPAALPAAPATFGSQSAAFLDPPVGISEAELPKFLSYWNADDYDDWLKVGMALHHETRGSEAGLDAWCDWSEQSVKFVGRDDLAHRWAGFGRSRSWLTMRSIIQRARDAEKALTASVIQQLIDYLADCPSANMILDALGKVREQLARDYDAQAAVFSAAKKRYKELTGQMLSVATLRKAISLAHRSLPAATKALTLDRGAPFRAAADIVAHYRTLDGRRALHYQQGTWYTYAGTHYAITPQEDVRSFIWQVLDKSNAFADEGPEAYKPNMALVSNVQDAAKSVCALDGEISAPAWLDGRPGPDTMHLLPMANGLLDVRTETLHAHDPQFFCTYSLPYAWRDTPQPCPRWLQFLNEIFPGDREAQDTLEEIMGYVLLQDTSLQRMFLFVGETRSGKGTIARVLKGLIGDPNVIGPQMATLGGQFGLQNWIGVPLSIIPDARIGRTNHEIVIERLLTVSSGDTITVDRKNVDHWTGVLPTRIIILTNKVPSLPDGATALFGRFVTLHFKQSFLGREDTGLSDQLLSELSGILQRVLAARARLYSRGHFITPASSATAVRDLKSAVSGINDWIMERCEEAPEMAAEARILYADWKIWCREVGRDHPGTLHAFLRDLHAARPLLTTRNKDSTRLMEVVGIKNLQVVNTSEFFGEMR